jgi:hypothetical protein
MTRRFHCPAFHASPFTRGFALCKPPGYRFNSGPAAGLARRWRDEGRRGGAGGAQRGRAAVRSGAAGVGGWGGGAQRGRAAVRSGAAGVGGWGAGTEAAARFGVSRQSVHAWIRRYRADGLAGLEDRSHRPVSCPHQTDGRVEAAVCELRREHPRWGPTRLHHELVRSGGGGGAVAADDLPGAGPPRAAGARRPASSAAVLAVGARYADAAVAGRRDGRRPPGRRDRVEADHPGGRPLAVLRDRHPRAAGHR